jgi:hypothetical protein
MTNIKDSDFLKKHRTEWQNFLWEKFLYQLSKEGLGKESRVSSAFFSKHEKRIITQRLAILILLREGRGPREISRLLFVSKNTVTTARKNFFGNHETYKSQRELPTNKKPKTAGRPKSIQKNWLDKFLSDIDLWEIIKNPPRPPGIGLKN